MAAQLLERLIRLLSDQNKATFRGVLVQLSQKPVSWEQQLHWAFWVRAAVMDQNDNNFNQASPPDLLMQPDIVLKVDRLNPANTQEWNTRVRSSNLDNPRHVRSLMHWLGNTLKDQDLMEQEHDGGVDLPEQLDLGDSDEDMDADQGEDLFQGLAISTTAENKNKNKNTRQPILDEDMDLDDRPSAYLDDDHLVATTKPPRGAKPAKQPARDFWLAFDWDNQDFYPKPGQQRHQYFRVPGPDLVIDGVLIWAYGVDYGINIYRTDLDQDDPRAPVYNPIAGPVAHDSLPPRGSKPDNFWSHRLSLAHAKGAISGPSLHMMYPARFNDKGSLREAATLASGRPGVQVNDDGDLVIARVGRVIMSGQPGLGDIIDKSIAPTAKAYREQYNQTHVSRTNIKLDLRYMFVPTELDPSRFHTPIQAALQSLVDEDAPGAGHMVAVLQELAKATHGHIIPAVAIDPTQHHAGKTNVLGPSKDIYVDHTGQTHMVLFSRSLVEAWYDGLRPDQQQNAARCVRWDSRTHTIDGAPLGSKIPAKSDLVTKIPPNFDLAKILAGIYDGTAYQTQPTNAVTTDAGARSHKDPTTILTAAPTNVLAATEHVDTAQHPAGAKGKGKAAAPLRTELSDARERVFGQDATAKAAPVNQATSDQAVDKGTTTKAPPLNQAASNVPIQEAVDNALHGWTQQLYSHAQTLAATKAVMNKAVDAHRDEVNRMMRTEENAVDSLTPLIQVATQAGCQVDLRGGYEGDPIAPRLRTELPIPDPNNFPAAMGDAGRWLCRQMAHVRDNCAGNMEFVTDLDFLGTDPASDAEPLPENTVRDPAPEAQAETRQHLPIQPAKPTTTQAPRQDTATHPPPAPAATKTTTNASPNAGSTLKLGHSVLNQTTKPNTQPGILKPGHVFDKTTKPNTQPGTDPPPPAPKPSGLTAPKSHPRPGATTYFAEPPSAEGSSRKGSSGKIKQANNSLLMGAIFGNAQHPNDRYQQDMAKAIEQSRATKQPRSEDAELEEALSRSKADQLKDRIELERSMAGEPDIVKRHRRSNAKDKAMETQETLKRNWRTKIEKQDAARKAAAREAARNDDDNGEDGDDALYGDDD